MKQDTVCISLDRLKDLEQKEETLEGIKSAEFIEVVSSYVEYGNSLHILTKKEMEDKVLRQINLAMDTAVSEYRENKSEGTPIPEGEKIGLIMRLIRKITP